MGQGLFRHFDAFMLGSRKCTSELTCGIMVIIILLYWFPSKVYEFSIREILKF